MTRPNARKRNPHGILKSDIERFTLPIRDVANWFKDDDGVWIVTVDKFNDQVISALHDGLGQFYHLEPDGARGMRFRVVPKGGYYVHAGKEPLGEETMDPAGRRVWRGTSHTDAIESAKAAFGEYFRMYSFGDIDNLNTYTEIKWK